MWKYWWNKYVLHLIFCLSNIKYIPLNMVPYALWRNYQVVAGTNPQSLHFQKNIFHGNEIYTVKISHLLWTNNINPLSKQGCKIFSNSNIKWTRYLKLTSIHKCCLRYSILLLFKKYLPLKLRTNEVL